MTYTEDRAVLEHDLFRPPYLARMLERAGAYTGAMLKPDRAWVLEAALTNFWNMRNRITSANSVTAVWDDALRAAVNTRKRWFTWKCLWGRRVGARWTRSALLGRIR